MKIVLLPLDERPANTRYPQHIAAVAGVELLLPPTALLPAMRTPANRHGLGQWLTQLASVARNIDGVVASIDLIGHGGLIASRTSTLTVDAVLQAAEPLMHVRTAQCPLFAFNVIQRISNANDNTEEPEYWGEYGTRLFRYSRVLDLALGGDAVAQAEQMTLEAEIPAVFRQQWLATRLRNHAVNLAMLHAAGADQFDLLVIPSDDTAPIGMSARERKHLENWRTLQAPGANVLLYPGADDLGSALVARMVNHKLGHSPKVFVHFGDESMRNNIAPYEDRPIDVAVATQIMAVGAQQTQHIDDADVILFVSPPFERMGDADPSWRETDPHQRRAALQPAVRLLGDWMRAGRKVAVADVAFPNGAEPALVELLLENVAVHKLAAFGGWNTAGNTLGTVLGAACVPCRDDAARLRQLAHHLLEDWAYQSVVRDLVYAAKPWTNHWPTTQVNEFTHNQLQPFAARIRAAGVPCVPTNVRHPWQRAFEIDFDLDATDADGVENPSLNPKGLAP